MDEFKNALINNVGKLAMVKYISNNGEEIDERVVLGHFIGNSHLEVFQGIGVGVIGSLALSVTKILSVYIPKEEKLIINEHVKIENISNKNVRK